MKKNITLCSLLIALMIVVTACGNKAEQSNGTPTGSIGTNKNNSALNNVDNTITNTINEPDTEPGEGTNNPEAEPTGTVTEGPKEENPSLTPDANVTNTPAPNVTENPDATPEPTRMPGATATPTPIRNNAVPTEAPVVVPTRTPVSGGVPTKAPTVVPTKAPTAVLTKAPTAVPTKAPTKVPTKAPVATSTPKATSTPTPTPTPHVVSYILVVDKKVRTIESRDKTIAMYYFEHDTALDYPYITSHTSWTAEQVKIAVANYTWETIFIDACRNIGETYHYIDDFVIGTEEIIVDVDYVYPDGTYGILQPGGWIACNSIKDTVGCIYSDGRVVRY